MGVKQSSVQAVYNEKKKSYCVYSLVFVNVKDLNVVNVFVTQRSQRGLFWAVYFFFPFPSLNFIHAEKTDKDVRKTSRHFP